jgi:LPS export ABC transporter permease LptG
LLGKIDRYLARSFLEPFLVATSVILGLYLVADAFGNLEYYLREAPSFGETLARMGKIYLLRIPVFLAPIIPFSMLVGAAYGIAQLSGRNEITAMKASGLSFWRILAPIYAIAAFIAFLSFLNREMLVPEVEQITAAEKQLWSGDAEDYTQVVDYIDKEKTHYVLNYNAAKRRVKNLVVIKTVDGKTFNFYAAEATPAPGGWALQGVKGQTNIAPGNFWQTSLRPRDLELRLLPLSERPIKMLSRLIRKSEQNEEPRLLRQYRLFYHSRMAYPFTGIILVGLGVPFVVGNERIQRSRMLGIGVCLAICMVFYTVQFIANDLGREGQLAPAIAAWLPNVIFAGVGMYLLETVHG